MAINSALKRNLAIIVAMSTLFIGGYYLSTTHQNSYYNYEKENTESAIGKEAEQAIIKKYMPANKLEGQRILKNSYRQYMQSSGLYCIKYYPKRRDWEWSIMYCGISGDKSPIILSD